MSHVVGTVQAVSPIIIIGPDSGAAPSSPQTWTLNFPHTPAPTGTKFLILHFQNAQLPGNNRLEVDLGYDTDVFTSADGVQFWTRPINVYALAGGLVPIRYITNGATTGGVQLDVYGRGEQHAGQIGHPSISNCDPFQKDAVYTEPTYDPFWFCANPPNWENVGCVPAADVRARVARSVGMIVTVEGLEVSTCSVTLIDTDKILTAGHCHTPEQVVSSSVIFDYETDCAGNRPAAYSPQFHKVKGVVSHRWDGSVHDFSLLQLKTAPAGIPTIQMRHDVPGLGEQVFGVHHPNGAIKKLSVPHAQGFTTVTGSGSFLINVPSNFHVSGGSSGSGLFDTAGRIVGVCSNGAPCQGSPLKYFPTAAILKDLVPTPPPPISRDVVLVVDRSGSMSLDDGTGRTKIEAARDAVSLFVQLVRTGAGNRLGLVSFSSSASSPPDFKIASATQTAKNTLIGPPPFSGGKVGALAPGGNTSIGEGLDAARVQFPAPGTNPRAILLMTDGLQNTPRMISDVEGAISGIDVHAIGFGPESSIDGGLLTALANSHNGLYTRAQGALSLEKFFAHAFGNIFETGVLFDPEYVLAAGQRIGDPVKFRVCGEEKITLVVGWDRTDASLQLEIMGPSGATTFANSPGVEASAGRTWTFVRFDLPREGDRDGVWTAQVFRPGRGEFAASGTPALRYFINVIPTGGPRFYRIMDNRRYYTGDSLVPRVAVRYANGSWPEIHEARLTVTRPDAGVGNILAKAGLRKPTSIGGDTIPARQTTLLALESENGAPAVTYHDTNFLLSDEPADTEGLFEAGGVMGKALKEYLNVEGNYTFHAQVTYGDDCIGTREVLWSIAVAVGIDPDHTVVTSEPGGTGPDGNPIVHVTVTPGDKYGNLVGPGASGGFNVTGSFGTTVVGPVTDNGDGSYTVDVSTDPTAGDPGIVVTQPERPPVVMPVPPPMLGGQEGDRGRYVYSVQFLCGVQENCECACAPTLPGKFATAITIHNPLDIEVAVRKLVIPVVFVGAAVGREPHFGDRKAADKIVLPPHSATMDDCCRLSELLLGATSSSALPISIGVLEITSDHPLSVSAAYTVIDLKSKAVSLEVRQIEARRS